MNPPVLAFAPSRPAMLPALLYLRLTSLRNRIRVQLQRLRQPKYLAGALFVVAYFWFFFFRRGAPTPQAIPTGTLPADLAPFVVNLVALGLSVLLLLMWFVPNTAPGVKFTEAEIAFLFPAPLARRTLIHFKVLSLQFSSLLQSCFFALIFNHRALLHGHALQIIVSWWLAFSFVNLHYLASSLTIARLEAAHISAGRRRQVLAIAAAAVVLLAIVLLWPQLAPGPSTSLGDTVSAALTKGPLPWLLLPARIMIAPFFAAGAGAFALAVLPALALLAAHYLWTVRMEVAFEEASIATAERHAAQVAEVRRTGTMSFGAKSRAGRRDPFNLARTRWPEFAFLWKNLLSTVRPWFTVRAWLIAAGVLVAVCLACKAALGSSYWMAGGALAAFGIMATGMALFYGPLLTRLDLRQDLINADILRTYPLPGWRIMLGELLAPTAVLTGIIWLGLLAWYLGLHGHHPPSLSEVWFSPGMRLVLVGILASLTPFVVLLQLLVPNGAVILFPAMFRSAHTPGTGLDLMGQRMLFGFGQIFVLALVLLPAALTAVLLVFCTQWLIGPAASLIFAALAVALVLTGEIWCGVWWLGDRFERLDLSADVRP